MPATAGDSPNWASGSAEQGSSTLTRFQCVAAERSGDEEGGLCSGDSPGGCGPSGP